MQRAMRADQRPGDSGLPRDWSDNPVGGADDPPDGPDNPAGGSGDLAGGSGYPARRREHRPAEYGSSAVPDDPSGRAALPSSPIVGSFLPLGWDFPHVGLPTYVLFFYSE